MSNGCTTVLGGATVIDEADHRITIPNGYSILAGATFRMYTGSGDNDPMSGELHT